VSLNKKAYILTNGCPENRIDAARLEEFSKQNGYIITQNLRDADIVFFNACAHTQSFEDGSIRIINYIKLNKKSSAELIVCGCLSKINGTRLRTVHKGVALGPGEMEKLAGILNPAISFESTHSNYLIKITKSLYKFEWALDKLKEKGLVACILKLLGRRQDAIISVCRPNTFCIKVCSGCLGNCTFCAIRFSRGKLKSKPLERIVEEFQEGLRRGYKDFSLIGTEVGAYGKDLGIDLVTLLKELVSKRGEYKIRLRNIHPKYLIEMLPELRKIFQSGRISFLSTAPESGNNRTLGLMNRGYKVEDFKEAIHTLNKDFSGIQLRAQVMVGFPTETEEEFKDTVKLVDELKFDFVEIYMFQPRPGTKAATMAGQISQDVIKRRHLKLMLKLLFKRLKI